MCTRLWIAWAAVTISCAQQNNNVPFGATFGWGWRLSPLGDPAGTVGHYYVKLPQAEQQVSYTADGSGYHGAHSLVSNGEQYSHSQTFALGQKAIGLTTAAPDLVPNAQTYNYTQPQYSDSKPFNFYAQKQYNTIPQNSQRSDYYKGLTQLYDIKLENDKQTYENHAQETKTNSKPLDNKEVHELRPIVQVFKDHNCTDDEMSKDLANDLNKSKQLFDEVKDFEWHDFDQEDLNHLANRPFTYRGAVHFRVETPKPNARQERFYYTTIEPPTYSTVSKAEVDNVNKEGINKLVASTQDLITNEDLLKINHAEEKAVNDIHDDIIRPRARWVFNRIDADGEGSRTNHITVTAKIGNIVDSQVENRNNFDSEVYNRNSNSYNNFGSEGTLNTNSNSYTFAAPIFVPDPNYDDVKEQVLNNLVSTMVPYIANGYQIVNVREYDRSNNKYNTTEDTVNVTPRPVSQNYLAPITVALRLINDNDAFDNIDDHEAADSELVSKTVQSPRKEKTVVEVQESIPVEITHINAVEVHDSYLEEGRSNDKGAYNFVNSLYNKYLDALAYKNAQDKANKINYNEAKDNKYDYDDNLEPSENIQSSVQVKNLNENTQRSESVNYYNVLDENQRIVQPIVIEKEVPVTQFVDRYIEKQVPQPYEVQVPVDRPVPVAVPYDRIVEKPVEVTKYVDKPYPVEVPRPYPVEVKVPYPVEQKVYVDRPVHVPYPVEKVVEKAVVHPVPVPTPIGIPYEVQVPVEHQVLYPIPIDRPVPYPVEVEKPVEKIVHKEIRVPYPVEKRVPYPVHYETRVPVPYPVEKRVPVPVERIVEKPVTVMKVVEKPVHVPVPQPYPVDRIVEKRVNVPYPVEKIVEKIVEKPVVVTKYVDKPYPVEVKVPYPVDRIVEKPVHIPIPVYRNNFEGQETRTHNYHKDTTGNYPYYQLLTEKVKKEVPVTKTFWGNQYAVSHQYVNNTTGKSQQEKVEIPKASSQYYGPTPSPQQEDWWQKNKKSVEDVLRRKDRELRVDSLRIEYGGFKPPLVPSTEVDSDGLPVKS